MLALVLLLHLAQIPPVPGETSLVSFCKQGMVSACEALRVTEPHRVAQIEEALRRAATLRAAQELTEHATQEVEAEAQESDNAPEPPDCKGQEHHIISRPIAAELAKHPTLGGLYKPRDPRFVAQARDEPSHCGYQQWHRQVDKEVIAWLKSHERATAKQFEAFLREIYNRPDMRARFPNGF